MCIRWIRKRSRAFGPQHDTCAGRAVARRLAAAGVISTIAAALALCAAAAAPEKVTIYFYSAETNINNFKSLKMEFDGYLALFGDYEFQPFSDRHTFEEHVKDRPHSLLLLSSWHYANIFRDYGLTPVLVGVRNGKTSQKRLLVSSDQAANLDQITAGQIASASSVQHTTSILAPMFHADEHAAAFKILTVPKDLDALMSVGFGMAKSALITEHSFELLHGINPSLHKKLNIIAESDETLLLIVAAPENFAADAQDVLAILRQMVADPNGEKRMRMLGLDDWQPLVPADKAKLEG